MTSRLYKNPQLQDYAGYFISGHFGTAKFRVWDVVQRKFDYGHNLKLHSGGYLFDAMRTTEVSASKRHILSFFTEFYDSKRGMVYGGDFVRLKARPDTLGLVWFQQLAGLWTIDWTFGKHSYWKLERSWPSITRGNQMLIAGNFFEHKELYVKKFKPNGI